MVFLIYLEIFFLLFFVFVLLDENFLFLRKCVNKNDAILLMILNENAVYRIFILFLIELFEWEDGF